MRLKLPSSSAPRSIGRLMFRGGLDSMLWAAISIGAVVVATTQIVDHGGFTPQTSVVGFGSRVLLIVAGVANLVQKWRRRDISWRSRRDSG